jgi:serine/threonine-protein kinase
MTASPDPQPAPGASWEELFDELAELPPRERARRLDTLRTADPELADRLARMLKADAETEDFFSRPAVNLLTSVSGEESEEGPALPEGTVIGSWCLRGLLGRGGMGEVYLAERGEGSLLQRAALKLIKKGMDSRAIVRRFLRERQILSRLSHPAIARLIDGGQTADGRPYFVLEVVEGQPITDYCRQRALGLEDRLRLFQRVCAAVDSAHRSLIVHRDLKPANILVTAEGEVKLLDFGIARLLSDDGEESAILTRLGDRVLTPAYAAPEQILGEPITMATDVYALGVLLFELITGALPHSRSRTSLGSLASGVERETIERPSDVLERDTTMPAREAHRLARRVEGDLDLIVLTALHREPARRYRSAALLSEDLGNFLAQRPIRARPDTLRYRLRKLAGRNRVAVVAGLLGLLALCAGLGVALWQARVAWLSAQRADAEARRAQQVKSFLFSVFRQSDPESAEGAGLTARDLLDRGAQRIEAELAGDPITQAEMLAAIARIEINVGSLDRGLEHARRALRLRKSVLAHGDCRLAESRALLGEAQKEHGEVEEARHTLEQAVEELAAARGDASLETARARRLLAGTLLHRTEDLPLGVNLLQRSLAVFRQRLGDPNPETAETLGELGILLERSQRYPEAEQAYRQSLARLERKLGPSHVKVASARMLLAGLLDRLYRAAEAQPLFEQAIAAQRAALGNRHPLLAETLFSYGIFLLGQQKPDAAENALREALGIFGPKQYQAGHCLRYLGVAAADRERYAEAASLFSRAAANFERTLGADDLQRWRALANLGWAHLRLGRTAEARRELTKAVARIERLSGTESYELRLPLKELGEALTTAGEGAEAVATLERVRRLEVKLFGTPQNRAVAGSDLLLARARLVRGAPGDAGLARQALDEALLSFAKVAPEDLLYGHSLLESGRLALAEGDRGRARRELAAAEHLLAVRRGPDHPQTREARRLLKTARPQPAARNRTTAKPASSRANAANPQVPSVGTAAAAGAPATKALAPPAARVLVMASGPLIVLLPPAVETTRLGLTSPLAVRRNAT